MTVFSGISIIFATDNRKNTFTYEKNFFILHDDGCLAVGGNESECGTRQTATEISAGSLGEEEGEEGSPSGTATCCG